jgi:hypothetical protein
LTCTAPCAPPRPALPRPRRHAPVLRSVLAKVGKLQGMLRQYSNMKVR